MRSSYLALLLLAALGLGVAVGARFNPTRRASAQQASAEPDQLDISLTKTDLDALRRAAAETQPSTHLADTAAPAATNPIKNIRIMCPNPSCRTIIVVPETSRGTVVKCSNCAMLFRIPAKSLQSPSAAAMN